MAVEKGLRELETGVGWANEGRGPINRATAPGKASGAFYLDVLAFCYTIGKGNEVIKTHQREALTRFLNEITVMPLPEYRKAVRGLRSEMEPTLRQALKRARLTLIRACEQRAVTALDKISSMRWEELDDRSLFNDLSMGLSRLHGGY